MHVRNFLQAKLGSEINVRFLLNDHGDLYFLLHYNSVHIVLLNLKKTKKLSEGKTDIGDSARNCYSVMQIMTIKITTLRTSMSF